MADRSPLPILGDRIVGVFETADRARAALVALVEAGIDNASIELLDKRSDLDNWTAVKRDAVPDKDAHPVSGRLGPRALDIGYPDSPR